MGVVDTVGSGSIVYDAEDIGPTLLDESFAKNFSVDVEFTLIDTGLAACELEILGVVPSLV
jgi:hypothetical protein